jgi:uncharacterized protein
MAIDGLTDADIRHVLGTTKRIAMVGASNKPHRPSNEVMGFLLRCGFEVVPVNPGLAGQSIHGQRVAATLADAAPFDMVDVFRAPEHVGPIMDEAIRLGAKTVWMQLGVINEAAAARGREAGVTVVMNRCPAIEWPRLRMAA